MKKFLKIFVPALALFAMASCTKAEQVGWLTVGDQYFNNELSIPAEGAIGSLDVTTFNPFIVTMGVDIDEETQLPQEAARFALVEDLAYEGGEATKLISFSALSLSSMAPFYTVNENKHNMVNYYVSSNDNSVLKGAVRFPVAREAMMVITNQFNGEVLTGSSPIGYQPVLQKAEDDIMRKIMINQAAGTFALADPDIKLEFDALGKEKQIVLLGSYGDVEYSWEGEGEEYSDKSVVKKNEYSYDGYDLFGFGKKTKMTITATLDSNDTHEVKKGFVEMWPMDDSQTPVNGLTIRVPYTQAAGFFAAAKNTVIEDYHEHEGEIAINTSFKFANLEVENPDNPNDDFVNATLHTTESNNNPIRTLEWSMEANDTNVARADTVFIGYTHKGADEGPISIIFKQEANPNIK